MAGARAFGRDRERLHALPHEAQRFGQRTGEVAKRAQFADVFRERRPGPMIQRVAARRAMLEERQARASTTACSATVPSFAGRRDGVHQRR